MKSSTKIIATALALILGTVLIGYVVAQYTIYSTNHITGNPGVLPSLTLSANNTNVVLGDTLQITASVGTTNIGQSGWVVTLYNNTVAMGPSGTGVTNGAGQVTFNIVVTSPYDFNASATHP